MPVTSCSSKNTKAYFEKHIIITMIIIDNKKCRHYGLMTRIIQYKNRLFNLYLFFFLGIECPVQPAPANGAILYPNGRNLDDLLVYTCNSGYVIRGTTSRQCLSTGLWASEAATCTCKNTHIIQLLPGSKKHAPKSLILHLEVS